MWLSFWQLASLFPAGFGVALVVMERHYGGKAFKGTRMTCIADFEPDPSFTAQLREATAFNQKISSGSPATRRAMRCITAWRMNCFD